MGRFAGFYTGAEDAEEKIIPSETEIFARRNLNREGNKVSGSLLSLWRKEFQKCVSISDYQNYIKKYSSQENPYIVEAMEKVDNSGRSLITPVNKDAPQGKKGDPFLFLRIIGTILLFGVIGLVIAVFESPNQIVKIIIVGCGLAVLKWIWDKD